VTPDELAAFADIECCDITTVGRRTGSAHEIEIWFGVVGDELCLISGNGDTADWYRNLLAEPRVQVRVDSIALPGIARAVADPLERRRIGDVMRAKYVWDGDASIGLTYDAWCYDVPAVSIAFETR
jgi:deazaflavin-dependent oxidoreductase (nitroreductase family)